MIELEQTNPVETIPEGIAARVRKRRKELGLTQAELAKRSAVSLGSVKRFEREHKISLEALVRISVVLRSTGDFDQLFARRQYRSIQEVIDERRNAR
ncbi:MAG: helix-turn-helix transcriptional regulator [Coriobacteriales bacterium]|jgi:transcriptional regulator with XRE-family HTH domain|nr:helix-turn-helix transcriptional regulator [Coriobacteriales bacterium]